MAKDNNAGQGKGGGVYNLGNTSQLTVANSTFIGNEGRGDSSGGGAIGNASSLTQTITNCTFTENAAAYGAGVYSSAGQLNITNCTFAANTMTQVILGADRRRTGKLRQADRDRFNDFRQ